MPKPPTSDLAAALERVQQVARDGVVRTKDLSRRERELLVSRHWLVEIIRGWYLLTRPDAAPGDTARWHASFWPFVGSYLEDRFGSRYCLSAENSLDLWTGRMTTPNQLTVISASGGATRLELPSGAVIVTYPNPATLPATRQTLHGLQVMPLEAALIRATPTLFRLDPTTAEIALRQTGREPLARAFLTSWNAAGAARVVGGLRHLGLNDMADGLCDDLEAAGYVLPVTGNPFETPPRLPAGARLDSPHAGRVDELWHRFRDEVFKARPPLPRPRKPADEYLREVREIYTRDAYNSLSIEGYQVTPDLIRRIADGSWDPDSPSDRQHADAMAARGYRDAFLKVQDSVKRVLEGANAGGVFSRDLQTWYRALFGPSVQAGILEPWQLAGYRDRAVFIAGSHHVPPPRVAVPACMEVLVQRLEGESDAWVRAVLGHFLFVFIHPYSDGNGRLGRFLMNLQLASGGYPWTVVRLERRGPYMTALEKASVEQEITPLNTFLAMELAATSGSPDA